MPPSKERRTHPRHANPSPPLRLPNRECPTSRCQLRLKTNYHRPRSHSQRREPTRRDALEGLGAEVCRSLRTLVLLDTTWAWEDERNVGDCVSGVYLSYSCCMTCSDVSTKHRGEMWPAQISVLVSLTRLLFNASTGVAAINDGRARLRFKLWTCVRDGCHHCRSHWGWGTGRRGRMGREFTNRNGTDHHAEPTRRDWTV